MCNNTSALMLVCPTTHLPMSAPAFCTRQHGRNNRSPVLQISCTHSLTHSLTNAPIHPFTVSLAAYMRIRHQNIKAHESAPPSLLQPKQRPNAPPPHTKRTCTCQPAMPPSKDRAYVARVHNTVVNITVRMRPSTDTRTLRGPAESEPDAQGRRLRSAGQAPHARLHALAPLPPHSTATVACSDPAGGRPGRTG